MKHTFLFVALALCSFRISAQNSVLKITPKKPEVGQKVTVTYTGKLAAKEGTKLSFVSYFARNNYIPQKGIETKRVGNSLVGSFVLPVTFHIL